MFRNFSIIYLPLNSPEFAYHFLTQKFRCVRPWPMAPTISISLPAMLHLIAKSIPHPKYVECFSWRWLFFQIASMISGIVLYIFKHSLFFSIKFRAYLYQHHFNIYTHNFAALFWSLSSPIVLSQHKYMLHMTICLEKIFTWLLIRILYYWGIFIV